LPPFNIGFSFLILLVVLFSALRPPPPSSLGVVFRVHCMVGPSLSLMGQGGAQCDVLLFWVWVIIFVTWHGASPNALSKFSCSSNRWCLWLFCFPLGLFFTFGYMHLGFGFGPFWRLSFRSSSALFVFGHPFCFATKGVLNVLSPP
jgi:hypothetical protein